MRLCVCACICVFEIAYVYVYLYKVCIKCLYGCTFPQKCANTKQIHEKSWVYSIQPYCKKHLRNQKLKHVMVRKTDDNEHHGEAGNVIKQRLLRRNIVFLRRKRALSAASCEGKVSSVTPHAKEKYFSCYFPAKEQDIQYRLLQRKVIFVLLS